MSMSDKNLLVGKYIPPDEDGQGEIPERRGTVGQKSGRLQLFGTDRRQAQIRLL